MQWRASNVHQLQSARCREITCVHSCIEQLRLLSSMQKNNTRLRDAISLTRARQQSGAIHGRPEDERSGVDVGHHEPRREAVEDGLHCRFFTLLNEI